MTKQEFLLGKNSLLILGFSLAICCVVHCVSQVCNRTDSAEGYKLNGHVFQSKTQTDILCCLQACRRNEACQSFNYNLVSKSCELSNRTKNGRLHKFLPVKEYLYVENPFRGILGEKRTLPGTSCKDIRDSHIHLLSGDYWIKPAWNEDPFTAYCDMTTDGGGWTLVARTLLNNLNNPFPPIIGSKSYRAISNYTMSFIRVDVTGIYQLRNLTGFTQMRYYCKKKATGRTFHVMTSPNKNGRAVVKYFTEDPLIQPKACGSFTRLPDDNSILSQNCDKWGNDGIRQESGKWGRHTHNGTFRVYNDPIFWEDNYYINFKTTKLACDDSKTALFPLSIGDTWQLFVR